MIYILFYTVGVVALLSLCWYCVLLFRFVKRDLQKLKSLRRGVISSYCIEDDRKDLTGFKTMFSWLTVNQQVFAGICLANFASVIFLTLALYVMPLIVVFYSFSVALFVCCGVLYNVKRYYAYEEVTETDISLDNYITFLSSSERLIFGATLYSAVVLLLLCLT